MRNMKKLMYRAIVPAIAIVLMTTGCSVFSKNSSGNQASSYTSKTKRKEMPKDRESVVQKKSQQIYTPDEIKRGIIKGDWAIETVMGKKAVGEKAPYIKFVPSEKRIYGNNGCNVINGTYTCTPKDSVISFHNIASTMMLCSMDGLTDYEINSALGATKFYSWLVSGTEYHLTFYNENRAPVMTLMHQNFDFLNGTWQITRINGEEVDAEGLKIVIDIDEGKLHGNTGCNIINGELETDMDTPNSISFSKIGMTRMACPNSGWETRMTMALEEAVTAKRISKDEIEFIGSNGQQVMLLKRTSPIED